MAPRVRPALPADAEAIARVDASGTRTLRAVYRPTPAAIAGGRALRAGCETLVAELDGELVGVVRLRADGDGDDTLQLFGLFVDEAHRRRGVARALVAAACARNYARIALHTIAETGNVPIFERLGFVTIVEQRADDVVGEGPLTDVAMELRPGRPA
jgi:GNAT superfamily N-acetyltransferase